MGRVLGGSVGHWALLLGNSGRALRPGVAGPDDGIMESDSAGGGGGDMAGAGILSSGWRCLSGSHTLPCVREQPRAGLASGAEEARAWDS